MASGSPYLTGVPLARFSVSDGLGGADRYGALATSRDRRRERRWRPGRRTARACDLAARRFPGARLCLRYFVPGNLPDSAAHSAATKLERPTL